MLEVRVFYLTVVISNILESYFLRLTNGVRFQSNISINTTYGSYISKPRKFFKIKSWRSNFTFAIDPLIADADLVLNSICRTSIDRM